MDLFNVLGWSDTEEVSEHLGATQPKVKPVNTATKKDTLFSEAYAPHLLISENNKHGA